MQNKNGVKLDTLVDGTVAVDDASAADGFVVVGDQDESVLSVEFSFKCVHRQPVNVLVKGLTLAHVFRWNADGVFLGYDLVHFITSLRSQEGRWGREVKRLFRPSPVNPQERMRPKSCLPPTTPI